MKSAIYEQIQQDYFEVSHMYYGNICAMKQKMNKHPKYGDLPKRTRRNNGYNRVITTQHRLKIALQKNITPGCKYTIICFDEDKDRYVLWGSIC